jgi:hypothetical protein
MEARSRLERRKTIGKSKDSVPEERKSVCPPGMKDLETTVPEERLPDLYFWRKQKMSLGLRESFPAALAH